MANTSLLYKKLSALSVKGKGTSKEEFKPQAFRKEYGVIILFRGNLPTVKNTSKRRHIVKQNTIKLEE